MDIIQSKSTNDLRSDTTVSNYLIIFYDYSKIIKSYGTEKITTEQVRDKLDMFQYIFGKTDKFEWWYLEIISSDEESQFTSTEFKEEFQTCGVHLMLAAPYHQEMNGQVEVIWRTLCTISHCLMLNARVL